MSSEEVNQPLLDSENEKTGKTSDRSTPLSLSAAAPAAPTSTPTSTTETATATVPTPVIDASPNRSRIVSLDHAADGAAPPKPKRNVQNPNSGNGNNNDDDADDISDGESSYFAKHLPSPKSGRLPFASTDSGSVGSSPMIPSVPTLYGKPSRESDASLSFSDDEEDMIVEATSGVAPIPTIANISSDTFHYRGITRMHSAGSLMSNASDDHENRTIPRNVHPDRQGYAYYQSALHGAPAPATIQTNPTPMTTDQMRAWMASGGVAPTGYGAINTSVDRSINSSESRTSYSTLPMVYSEDDSTIDHRSMAMASTGGAGGRRGLSFSDNFAGGNSGGGDAAGTRQVGGGGGGAFRDAAPGGPQARTLQQSEDILAEPQKEDMEPPSGKKGFKVYWQRWIMLFYMSILNLLSDWTCYSVAPIATLTREAFGEIDPEQLVVVFLGANAIATACEPIILSRLGLRRTVVFGALLLMLGSIVKSGGLPPILQSNLEKGSGEWRVYLGFFLVGLSQPLYQCTPALLSASWFPERERTMATGVALNANQLGIGFAFIFGTLLVGSSDDIVPYFGLLSMVATLAFIGSLIQFDDAPPTPPSDTARVIRGTVEWNLPSADTVWKSVRSLGSNRLPNERASNPALNNNHRHSGPSNSPGDGPVAEEIRRRDTEARALGVIAPSPMIPSSMAVGDVPPPQNQSQDHQDGERDGVSVQLDHGGQVPGYHGYPYHHHHHPYSYQAMPYVPHPGMYQGMPQQPPYSGMVPTDQTMEHPENFPSQPMHQGYGIPQGGYGIPQGYGAPYPPAMYQYSAYPAQISPYGVPYQQPSPYYPVYAQHYSPYESQYNQSSIDELAEPTLTITDHHLDINIRDDQIVLSTKACFARPGFVHALITFTVSGIVINTLSTFMDYLVRLNGAGREYVGIVGGSFQFVIMISSLIIGKQTDNSRAYYSVTIAMLVLGAFALAECGVSLDADRGGDLRWSLIIVAALVGPLQPVSTELGVEVAYPLSENTVLVIQQLFSNLLSALFIPFFKALRDVGTETVSEESAMYERPQYTFSFYLLIVLHASVSVFFATFNGRYLRYEHELIKKEREEQEEAKRQAEQFDSQEDWHEHYPDERKPLAQSEVM